MSLLHLSIFRADITPPVGHPLCGGWVRPAERIEDHLYALGVVLTSAAAPVVLCAVDWCEISNQEHTIWRETLAAAAGTSAERVAVHCVHQHDAPWPDTEAQELVRRAKNLPDLMDPAWCQKALEGVASAVSSAVSTAARPVTHVRLGQARVREVASNRRILGPDGKVRAMRYSACRDAAIRAEPEGLIDPFLKSISFWNEGTKLAVLHYYTTHPMSYYGRGGVSSDFIGLARERRIAEDSGTPHIYFSGCAGNIAAGKYNDGSTENRPVLSSRVYEALQASEEQTEKLIPDRLEWRTLPVALPPDLRLSEAAHWKILLDEGQRPVERYRAALRIVSIQRMAQGKTIPFTSLFLHGRLCFLHLPGEAFVEYQLWAQSLRPGNFVAVASYGDCGTGYIPLAQSYEEGGYEPTDAFVSPESEAVMRAAIAELLKVR